MTSTRWNAEVYDRIGKPMRRWAQEVIRDLALCGDETVLDAGCGSGSVTFDLLQQLPRGKIYAVDASADMIAKIARSIEERGIANVIPIEADLTDFDLPEQVDCVFSNAVLHWIADDDPLFACLFRATKPGGRLRAQCGGVGNIERLMAAVDAVRARRPFAQHLRAGRDSRKYRSPEAARLAMERAGWRDVRASTFASPVPFESEEDAALYLRTIILQDDVAGLPDEMQQPYLRAVIAETAARSGGPFAADYVRLDLWATRPR